MNTYEKLIKDLDSLKDYCEEMSKNEPHASWKKDIPMLQEAMDIIGDYERMAECSNRMIQHYETKAQPVRKNGLLCCPVCGKKVPFNHSHCHWCGKKIGWGDARKKGGDANDSTYQ